MEGPGQPGGPERPPSDGPSWDPPAGAGGYEQPAGSGHPPPPGFHHEPPRQQQTPGNAIASLVLGIVGLVICPIICSVLAIVFGQQARGQIERDPNLTGAGIATAGYVMGIVGLVLYGLLFAFWILVIAAGT